ncbi:aldo-keto reductase family 1 member A1-B isoform X2 [Venturia canescens]|uniref:aldo-keto reductase family 1 member A1-B isoform X2 n=1 Tax=Venturia canescens TaxID=32260 RepID=UPI001C9CC7E6|nr:aldo-keto reductase family 1 member A1-B isoform X2 [Venturia canescens]
MLLATDLEASTALENALEAGYRHIDTATVYENEAVLGKVLKKWLDSGKVKREDLFIVTKVPACGNYPHSIEKWIKKSLELLQLDYLDLYLIHVPFAFVEGEDLHPRNENGEILMDINTDHLALWKEMENQVKAGRTKAIGLSNFNQKQITKILSIAQLPISNLQIELHVYFQQKEMVEFCRDKGITVTAYSPLGSRGTVQLFGKTETIPDLLENPTILAVAKKHNKSPAQVALKYIIQNNIAAIPKSTNSKRIKENIDLFGWNLDDTDMSSIAQLDKGESARICDFSFLKGIQNHPEFPF